MVYTDETSFLGQLASSITDNYTNPGYNDFPPTVLTDAQMTAVLNETTYQTTGFVNNDLVLAFGNEKAYCGGCNGSFLLSFDHTTVGDSNGVFGVGVDIVENTGGPSYDAFVTFGDGSTEDFALAGNGFWGITSTSEVSSIAFAVDGLPTTEGAFAITDLTIGSSVPEPNTLALLGTALLGMVLFTRTRSRLVRRRARPGRRIARGE
jgi:hypothetical protein